MDPNKLLETLNSRTSAKLIMELSFLILFWQFKAYFLEFDANPNVSLVISNCESVDSRVRFGQLGDQIGPLDGPVSALVSWTFLQCEMQLPFYILSSHSNFSYFSKINRTPANRKEVNKTKIININSAIQKPG